MRTGVRETFATRRATLVGQSACRFLTAPSTGSIAVLSCRPCTAPGGRRPSFCVVFLQSTRGRLLTFVRKSEFQGWAGT